MQKEKRDLARTIELYSDEIAWNNEMYESGTRDPTRQLQAHPVLSKFMDAMHARQFEMKVTLHARKLEMKDHFHACQLARLQEGLVEYWSTALRERESTLVFQNHC